MRRVSVVGNSGSGKSTLSRTIAASLGAPVLELDSVFHQPGWTQLPDADFLATVDAFTAAESWVVDGNYSTVSDLVWERADTVVWLDLPRLTIARQVVGRTARRVLTREELWNGNRERWSEVLRRDPQRSIIRWSWTQHDAYVRRYTERAADPRWAHLDVVRLRSRVDVDVFVQSLD